MNQLYLSLLLLCSASFLTAQAQTPQLHLGSEHQLQSTILDESRTYWVNLPASYHEEEASYQRYPVLIVLDGHAHFKSITGMVNYMSTGYNGNRKIPEMIVVGIQNVNRRRDFTPDKIITRRANDSGGGEKFLAFLEGELLPQLDKDFRTSSYKMLFGHSLGGLLAVHTYMKEKTLFNSFLAIDPSFGTWDTPTMDNKLDAISDQPFDRFIYLATANWGKRNLRNRDRHIRFYEAMNSRCTGEFPAKQEYFENENHGSVPVIAFHNGISSIFEGYGISYRDINNKNQLIDHFEAISKRLSYRFTPPEPLVNRVGYKLLRSKNEDDQQKALDFFLLNTINYPNSSNAFDSVGEAYESLHDSENALKNYKKSLALNPNNQHAEKKIESLTKTK